MLAVLLGCGLRRSELIDLTFDDIQRREDHWAIVDLVGKAAYVRTVPMPDWVKETLDHWLNAEDNAMPGSLPYSPRDKEAQGREPCG
jgi:integrase